MAILIKKMHLFMDVKNRIVMKIIFSPSFKMVKTVKYLKMREM